MDASTPRSTKRRIAVLGGGVGAMSAVYGLMRTPGWEERYDITIYQMGWRLGGKGASGRARDEGQRIEEHGLHIWLGFYENAFRLIRDVYAALDRPEGAPLRTWRDAFHPGSLIVFTDQVGGRVSMWPVEFPVNDGIPGDGGTLPTPAEYLELLLGWMKEHLRTSAALADAHAAHGGAAHHGLASWLREEAERFGAGLLDGTGAALLEAARLVAARIAASAAPHDAAHDHGILLGLLDHVMQWLHRVIGHLLDTHDELRRLFIVIDLAQAMLRGIVSDGVLLHGWQAINDIDLRAWLIRHGASERYSAWSSPMQAIYDLVFAYVRGNWSDPAAASLEAGTGAHGMLRMMLTYRGAIYWKMQAGMGDTIFAPFHELFTRYPESVRVKYFHQVMRIDGDGERVTAIDVFEQARLAEGRARYDPLVDVQGLPCWSSDPLYDQLDPDDARALQEGGINLESFWSPWRERANDRTVTLRVDEDFDEVILGIPPAMLEHLLTGRITVMPQWASMLAEVKSMQTQSTQLWLTPTLEDLGWTLPSPVLGGFVEPLSTWADMTHLLPREDWKEAPLPQSIAYFTGPMEDAAVIPPPEDTGFPARELARAESVSRAWLDEHARVLWPQAVGADGRLRDDLVRSRFVRANIDPNERYVLSVVGSSRFRLDAGGSGLRNLALAGDWVRTPINAGCVEAAVTAGLAAADWIIGGTGATGA